MRNFIVTIDGKRYQVGVEEIGESDGAKKIVPVAEQSQPLKSAPQSGVKVASPFPGLIKKILVADGTQVKKDQPVIVLEAMKMDNEITAPCDGKITFNVTNGANVETNAVLAVIG